MATITKRGETYKITVSCGYDMAGKQIRKNLTWKPAPGMTAKQIEKEVERQKVLFEEKCRTGQFLDGSTKFADFADKWMKEYAEKQLRPKTLAGYQALMKRIIPAIGHIRLDKLQPAHLLAFYDNLEESEMRDDQKYVITVDLMKALTESGIKKTAFAKMAKVGISTLDSAIQGNNVSKKSAEKISAALSKPINAVFKTADADSHLSGKTILHHHRLISSILSTAVQWQVIFSNPCERVKPPKVEKKEPRYLDEEEASRLLDLLDYEDIQYRTMIKLLLFTGFRRGELLGLEWPDIDFKSHVIHVRRSSLYLPEKGIFVDETKNATSSRTVKVQDDAFQMLREFRQWQTAQRLQVGDKWESTDRLFTSWDGKPLHPDTLSNWFREFVKKNNLPDISIHSLRHTNATLLIASHVPVTTVANRLGHANAATTTRIYAHAIKSADEAAAEILQNILKPASQKEKIG